MVKHNSNTIIKFADDTTLVGLITDNDETANREEVRELALWCQDNNLSLNVSKTKGADNNCCCSYYLVSSLQLPYRLGRDEG